MTSTSYILFFNNHTVGVFDDKNVVFERALNVVRKKNVSGNVAVVEHALNNNRKKGKVLFEEDIDVDNGVRNSNLYKIVLKNRRIRNRSVKKSECVPDVESNEVAVTHEESKPEKVPRKKHVTNDIPNNIQINSRNRKREKVSNSIGPSSVVDELLFSPNISATDTSLSSGRKTRKHVLK